MARKTAPKKTAPRKKPGRKSKLAAARPKILRGIADAIPVKSACLAAGISTSSLHNWRTAGTAELAALAAWESADPETRGEKPVLTEFGEFELAVELAEAKAEAKLVRAVAKKSPLEILKRRFPGTWGDKKIVALEGTEDGPPIKNEGGPPVILNLTFEDPADEELWQDETGENEDEEGGES
jgi:hypothetical protein